MNKITALVLTYNEEKNISSCLKNIFNHVDEIIVLDSGSTDSTLEIASSFNCKIYTNSFINQAHQINWAIDNISFKNNWIIRVDADENWNQQGFKILNQIILQNNYKAVSVKMKIYFQGKWLRWGGQFGNDFVRAFNKNYFIKSYAWMDEHINVNGDVFKSSICVEEKNYDRMFSLTLWTSKHNVYSIRECISYFSKQKDSFKSLSTKVLIKQKLKQYIFPIFPDFIGPLFLFLYRYLIQLGFLDGIRGFKYCFLQSLWYRYLVNLKISQYKINSKSRGIDPLELAKIEYELQLKKS
tara:strand:+ start:2905 stop:3795 length:891 start_codon:yes stop_codon:yes gene_type:complete